VPPRLEVGQELPPTTGERDLPRLPQPGHDPALRQRLPDVTSAQDRYPTPGRAILPAHYLLLQSLRRRATLSWWNPGTEEYVSASPVSCARAALRAGREEGTSGRRTGETAGNGDEVAGRDGCDGARRPQLDPLSLNDDG